VLQTKLSTQQHSNQIKKDVIMKNGLKPNDGSLHLDHNYKHFLSGIKERLQAAQIRAALAANNELIQFYWELGNDLIEKQKSHQWGSGFLEQFSHDMRQAFPEMQGFSKRNLEHMRRFATLYPKIEFAKQSVSQLPWGHVVRLMQMIKNDMEREWYAQQTIKNGWSRSVLEMQIESELYGRQAESNKKINNFHKQLPAL
jgi:predicted nuclease of restriction endonuclease-like (RecB) superfamily